MLGFARRPWSGPQGHLTPAVPPPPGVSGFEPAGTVPTPGGEFEVSEFTPGGKVCPNGAQKVSLWPGPSS